MEPRKILFKKYAIVTALAFEIVVLVVGGFFLGRYLDQKFGTDPVLLMTGVLVGFVGGVWRFYLNTKRFLNS